MVKRCVDVTLGLLLLVVATPFIALVGLLIRLDSKGPVFFRQARAGRNGRPFNVYKLRTMRRDTDPYRNSPQAATDPRVTRVGKWLRKTSVDELPQLMNVVLGDMSLVGPRPAFIHQAERYTVEERERLSVKPGITGLAQVRGRSGLTWEQRIALDREYVRRRSLLLDLAILVRTPIALVRGLATVEPPEVEPKHWSRP
jgi:sugar transferase EpsL